MNDMGYEESDIIEGECYFVIDGQKVPIDQVVQEQVQFETDNPGKKIIELLLAVRPITFL